MKFCKNISIVPQSAAPLAPGSTEPPLAYLVQADNDYTKEYDSNIQSANRWAIGYSKDEGVHYNFSNHPTSGFRIGRVATRHSTSNKFYRIIDPRGFQLEISTDNLNQIIQNESIEKGLILGEYVWAKSTRDYLCSVNSPEYKHWLNPPPKEKTKTLERGDYVLLPYDGEAMYLGKYYMIKGEVEYIRNPNYYGYVSINRQGEFLYKHVAKITKQTKPVHVFAKQKYYSKESFSTTTRTRLENFKLLAENERKHEVHVKESFDNFTVGVFADNQILFDNKELMLSNTDFVEQFKKQYKDGYFYEIVEVVK